LSLFNIPAITSCSNSKFIGFFTFYTPPITYLHTYLLPCRRSLLSLRHTALPLCTLLTLRRLVRTSVLSCTYSQFIYSCHPTYSCFICTILPRRKGLPNLHSNSGIPP